MAEKQTVVPYLIVNNVASLLDFMKNVFNAKETERIVQPDGRIMHAEAEIGESTIMMGEVMEDNKAMPGMLYVYMDNTDAAYDRAIAAGAESVQKPIDTFYGHRNAGVKDSQDNVWWIATRIENLPTNELQKRVNEQMN